MRGPYLVGSTSNHQVDGTSGEDRQGLERAKRGEVDYLAACRTGATGGIDYAENPGAAALMGSFRSPARH